jgi:hypothetical protein
MLIICRVCYAQTPNWEWARSAPCYYSNGTGEGWNVASDFSGNLFITGTIYDTLVSFDSIILYNPNYVPMANNPNAFIAKYDSNGNIQWAKNAAGSGQSLAYGIATDAQGNVYLTGNFFGFLSFGFDTLSYQGGDDIFLVKFDPAGNVLWDRSAGAAFTQVYSTIVSTDFFGNVFITGDFYSPTVIFGSDTLANAGNNSNDVFLAKYDSSGNMLWAHRAGGTGDDGGISVTCDQSGKAYLAGRFSSPSIIFGSDTLANTGLENTFIAKYDSSGNVIWGKCSQGDSTNLSQSIATHPTGNIFVAGYFNSPSVTFGAFNLLNTGNYTSFLVKYDSSGTVVWATAFFEGYPFKIASDSADNVYMSGWMMAQMTIDTITLSMPAGAADPMFIVKFDSSGHALWAKALASGGDDNNGIALGTGGSIYIGGDFYGINSFIIGNDTLIRTGSEDIFVAKLGYGSGVGIPDIYSKNKEFILYPNPFNDKLNITINNNELSDIILYDITSRNLIQQKFTNSISLNTEQLAKGIYLYEVRNKSGVIKKGKVVKD